MKNILRNLLSIFAGTFVAIVLIAVVQAVAHSIYPPPPGTDFNDPQVLAELIANAPLGALSMVLLSYVIGTFVGSWVGAKFSAPEGPIRQGLFVAALMLIAGVMNLMAIPHPVWFWVGTIVTIVAPGYFGADLSG